MLELLEFSEASRFHNRLVLAGVSRERERERKGGREGQGGAGRERARAGSAFKTKHGHIEDLTLVSF